MDVRCEKCLTIYELDDAQVGPAGVTVKCTQCGSLFKVRRRETAEMNVSSAAARSPAFIPPGGGGAPASRPAARPDRSTHPGIPVLPIPPVAQQPAPQPQPQPQPQTPPPPEEKMWMVRLKSNGETYRFREMTTLQQWIVERKVGRRDEISRTGDAWKALGLIAELEPFFQIVEQAQAPRPSPTVDDPALSTTAPMLAPAPMPVAGRDERSGPTSMGDLPTGDEAGYATTNRQMRVAPGSFSIPAVVDELADLDLDQPAQRARWPLAVGALVVLLGGGGAIAFTERDAIKKWFGPSHTKSDQVLATAHDELLLDTDDSFRHASAQLEQAHGADESDARVLAALAEVRATFAWDLREDARALDGGGPASEPAARTLRREAQSHLDEAKRSATDALALAPDSPDVNRAMADYQRVDGAPAPEVERYLKRALDRQPADAETVYVAGALAFRENKLDEARAKLEQANQLAASSAQHGLLRAELLLAKLALQGGKKDEARKWLRQVLAASPQHERARALYASVEAADAGVIKSAPDLAPAQAANPPVVPGAIPPKTNPANSATPTNATTKPEGADEPASYAKLVEKADHLSENGHTDAARKLYDKALTQQPRGLEALTGLGYCDLDKEKFMAAVDHFKQALAVSSDYGEALIGLAEAYKVRGDRVHAVEYYKRYLKAQPSGAKAAMAQKNLRDLEPPAEKTPPVEKATDNELPKTPEEKRAPDEPPP